MQQLIEFMTNHPILVTAFFVVLGLLIADLMSGFGTNAVDPQQAINLINQQKALVIDTRGKEDFDAGHIIDAVHVEGDNIDDSGALKKRGKQPLLIYCEQGSSSTRTVKRLSASGMTDVYALKGGLSAWRRQNLPLAKDDL